MQTNSGVLAAVAIDYGLTTASVVTFRDTTINPTFTQPTIAGVGHDFVFKPQATSGAGNASGNFLVELQPPGAGGTRAFLGVEDNGNLLAQLGQPSVLTGSGALWLGPVVNNLNQAAMWSDGTNTTVSCPSGAGQIQFGPINSTVHLTTLHGVQFFASDALPHFGGGSGVIGISDATTAPTTNPAGGVVVYSSAGTDLLCRDSLGRVTPLNAYSSHAGTNTAGPVNFTAAGATLISQAVVVGSQQTVMVTVTMDVAVLSGVTQNGTVILRRGGVQIGQAMSLQFGTGITGTTTIPMTIIADDGGASPGSNTYSAIGTIGTDGNMVATNITMRIEIVNIP